MLSNLFIGFFLVKSLIGWSALADITFKHKYVKQFNEQVEIPVFGKQLITNQNKEFVVSGYCMPVEEDRNSIILSKTPYSSCFFCGGAGIETVVEVHFSEKPRRLKIDEIIKVSGILKLNDSDFEHHIFIVENAKIIE